VGVQNTCSELSSMNVLLHERMDVISIKEWENWSTIELSVHEFKELGNPGIVLVESADTVIFFGLFMILSSDLCGELLIGQIDHVPHPQLLGPHKHQIASEIFQFLFTESFRV
jgi:hypothetical protein